MNPHLPNPSGTRYDPEQAERLVDALQRAFARVLSVETASPFALLLSPAGKVYRVTVSDAGALTTALVPQGRPL